MRAAIALVLGAVAMTIVLHEATFATPVTDFDLEAKAAVVALSEGDVGEALDRCPSYCGSLLLRMPFALLVEGAGRNALFAAMSVPAILVALALGFALWRRALLVGAGLAAAWTAFMLVVLNPIGWRALEFGHPEELITAACCAGAAVAAYDRRPVLTGVLLGLAVGMKLWPVLVVIGVLLVLPAQRLRAVATAVAVAALLIAPMALAGGGGIEQAKAVAESTGTAVEPAQIWWFFGDPGVEVRNGAGILQEGYRAAPAWVTRISHPLVVLVPLLISLALARSVARRGAHEALLLLTLVLLLRGLLDTWNTEYYPFAFLLSVLVWELHARRTLPTRTLAATALCWLSFVALPGVVSADAVAVVYLAWAVPLAAMLAVRLAAPDVTARARERGARLRLAVRRRAGAGAS